MCQLITPTFPCGHKDSGWLLYCNPTRRVGGRKHPPLETCSGSKVAKVDWTVFEPRCSRCEKRHRTSILERNELERRRRSTSAASSLSTSSNNLLGGKRGRRRTGSILDGIREMLRTGSSASSSTTSLRKMNTSESGSEIFDLDGFKDLDLSRSQSTTLLDGVAGGVVVDSQPKVVGTQWNWSYSSSSLGSEPCSPRSSTVSPPSGRAVGAELGMGLDVATSGYAVPP